MSSNLSVFPAGARCFLSDSLEPGDSGCPITGDMVSYLNVTNSLLKNYFPAYCLAPPGDDGCPFGYCPNPDIAGPLVRISAYLTNIFVAILIFYHPEELKESFWSQILTVYSLLITCGISIIQNQLTRIHAILATATAGSPLSLYIVIYAVRSIWNDGHRLAPAVGRGQIIPRIVCLTAMGVWVSLLVYILLPSHLSRFTQRSCEDGPAYGLIRYFFFLPIVIFEQLGSTWGQWIVTLPIQLTIVAWMGAILRRRREIWPRGQKYTFRFWKVWRVVSDNYPFIQFTSVVFIPFAYWVGTIEAGVLFSNDDYFSASFGQVLAMFVTLPPMIQVAKLIPRCFRWFSDLTWVRFITCRPQRRREPSSMGIPLVLNAAVPHGGMGDEGKEKYPLSGYDDRGKYDKAELIRDDA